MQISWSSPLAVSRTFWTSETQQLREGQLVGRMLLQRLATGATGVKQARYRRRPTRGREGCEALVRACAQRNHIKPLRCGHPSIKARGSFPNGGHYRGVPLYMFIVSWLMYYADEHTSLMLVVVHCKAKKSIH